jgi:hypothetical protein
MTIYVTLTTSRIKTKSLTVFKHSAYVIGELQDDTFGRAVGFLFNIETPQSLEGGVSQSSEKRTPIRR